MEHVLVQSGAVIIGLVLLAWSADKFVDGASGVAQYFGISPLVIGLTIVAFSTSAPEMLVSAFSAWQGNSGIAIGNAVGSNIANMSLVLGITALVSAVKVGPQTLNKEIPILLIGMFFALVILLWDDRLSRFDGLLLMSAMVFSICYTIHAARKQVSQYEGVEELLDEQPREGKISADIIWSLVIGLVVILASAKLLVWGAVGVAEYFGVSDLVIGLSIVAVGTSLPELAASIVAIRKGEHDMAVGNVIGSSLFNILAVLGIVGLIGPNTFDSAIVGRDYPIMLGMLIVFYLVTRRTPRGQSFTVQRWLGGGLVLFFFIYQSVILLGASTT